MGVPAFSVASQIPLHHDELLVSCDRRCLGSKAFGDNGVACKSFAPQTLYAKFAFNGPMAATSHAKLAHTT